jgi:PKD repeat protein
VSYTVGENGGTTNRTGTVTIAGRTFTVTQSGALVADLIGAPLTGQAPLFVQFSDLSLNGPTAWSWTFGDGGVSTEQNPGHTYRAAGLYTVTLTVAKAGESDTKTVTNYVAVSPCSYQRACVNGCCRSSLQAAYNECLSQGSTIEAQAQEFTENLTLSQYAPVTLKGGYTCDYSMVVPDTVLRGTLTITDGELTVEGLVIR